MTEAARHVLDQALRLSPDERAALVRTLLSSLSGEVGDEEADRARAEEVARRLARIEAGEVQTVPWEEVRARLRAELDA